MRTLKKTLFSIENDVGNDMSFFFLLTSDEMKIKFKVTL